MQRFSAWFWVSLTAVLLLSRLSHVNILWADEDYHLAAAIQMLHGKMLYRDLWYDKPPLTAMAAVLFGASSGWPLRIAGTALAAADAELVGILGGLDVNALGGACRCAKETGHALLQAVFVALQFMNAAIAFLKFCRSFGIVFR